MTKKAKKPARLATMASRIPWWASALLAITSYVTFYAIATAYRPTPTPTVQTDSATPKAHPASLIFIIATIGQYVLPTSFSCAAIASAMQSNMNWKNQRQLHEFKRKLARYYQGAGYEVITPPENRHNNIDLALNKGGKTYFVHCSHWRRHEIDVQQLRTFNAAIRALDAKGGYFVTHGEYTEAAWEYAEGRNIKLINGHRLQQMFPASESSPKATQAPPEAKVEIKYHPDAWYNTSTSKPKSATRLQEAHDTPKPKTKSPRMKKILIATIALSMLLAITLIRYATEKKPQNAPQPPKHLGINEARPPAHQQKPSPNQAAPKRTVPDDLQKNMGYQKTIKWWQQTNQGIDNFNNWIKASYAQVAKQTRQQGKKGTPPTASQDTTAEAFGQFLRSYYPGSSYDKDCSCGTIRVTPTNTLAFHNKWGTQSFRWIDQKITRKATFRNNEGTRYSAYEVSNGTNSITLLINTDSPRKSRYIKASMPDIAVDAKKMGERRRASPYNTSHTNPTHSQPSPTATILNDVYPSYIVKDNTGMNEYADQLVSDPKARQRLLRYASKLYN